MAELEQIGIRLGSPCPASEKLRSGWLKEFMDK